MNSSFDVVTSMNNFDHVDHPSLGIREVHRVLRRGGVFLIAVEIHPKPTLCEPQTLGWSFENKLSRKTGFEREWTLHWPIKGSHASTAIILEDSKGWRAPIGYNKSGWLVGRFKKY